MRHSSNSTSASNELGFISRVYYLMILIKWQTRWIAHIASRIASEMIYGLDKILTSHSLSAYFK